MNKLALGYICKESQRRFVKAFWLGEGENHIWKISSEKSCKENISNKGKMVMEKKEFNKEEWNREEEKRYREREQKRENKIESKSDINKEKIEDGMKNI